MEIVAATNNAGKLKELRRILEPMGYTLLTPADLGLNLDPEETGTTFEANALIKAEAFCKAAGKPVIADDSGLTVEALDGAPGVYSARYCGRHGDDEANNVKLLAELEDLEPDKRSACFVSAVCFCLPDGRHFTYMGRCPGWVGLEPVGENGFGYDPLFIPDEVGTRDGKRLPNREGRSYAQLQDWEKDAISHRGRALRLMQAKLADDLAVKA